MPIGGYAVVQAALASAARTTSGQTSTYNVEEVSRVTFYVNVTAVSGTNPTLDVYIQESPDQTNFFDVDTGDTISSTGVYRYTTSEHTKYIRLSYVIGGSATPTFTFKVDMIGRH